eukprot:TRINITY_DN6027_c0_g1_i5.p1 TRINITY_DN6027_c0_g1~~TRINITY_DN6027_c0_g1_i5.p1  ORF type:complete len:337 (+),score=81.13 TRINITY_DN6027_c0_g1_i5:865-1875(+)
MLGQSFEEFYAAAAYSSCPTVMSTPNGDMKAKMQCNIDSTVTYAEDCDGMCNCEASSTMTKAPGCYKANDMPGTMWFVKIEGCECAMKQSSTKGRGIVVEPAKPGKVVVSAEGIMSVKVSDPKSFCEDPDTATAFNRMMMNKFAGAKCLSTCVPKTGDASRRLQEGSVDFQYVLIFEVDIDEDTSEYAMIKFMEMQAVAANTADLTTSLVDIMTALKIGKNESVPEYLNTVEVWKLEIPAALAVADDSGETELVQAPEVMAPTPGPTPEAAPTPTPSTTSPMPGLPMPTPSTTASQVGNIMLEDGESGSPQQYRFLLASTLLLPLLAFELKRDTGL